MKWLYTPTGLSDLVVYFLRRIHKLLREGGFASIITTNSIIDGDVRKDGLHQVVSSGSQIIMAVRGVKWPGAANLVVSLLAIHRGKWTGQRMLDNRSVSQINSFFEEEVELREPNSLVENRHRVFQGSIFLGDGFLLTHEEAARLCGSDPRNTVVIMPIINGKEINNEPGQAPGRSIINFRNWSLKRAQSFEEPFEILEHLVRPERQKSNRPVRRERWWQHAERATGLYNAIRNLPRCFVAAATTKHLNFSAMPTDYVYSHALFVFTTDRWDLFAVVQSTLHEVWARKYSGSLKQDLRYSPSKCFDTFPFPAGLWQAASLRLTELGECYHTHRKELMQFLCLGLTKIYNLLHDRDLSIERVARVSKKDTRTAAKGVEALRELRLLQVKLDIAVRDAYGWQDLDLEHDFHEVETLPENDRLRFTISPAARREVLKRVLAENHTRAEAYSHNSNVSRVGLKRVAETRAGIWNTIQTNLEEK